MKNIKTSIVTLLLLSITSFGFSSTPLANSKKSFENKISYLLNLNSISKDQKVGSEVAVNVQVVENKLQILNISGNNLAFEKYIIGKIREMEIRDVQNFPTDSFIIRVKLQ